MNWIILALTLGASITSIIHGVFLLFGSLSISGGALPGIPSTMLASLPIVAAVFALIGGIIAFNRNKWGSLFLLIATGVCVASRDTWLYGGLYFFAGLFCFFLRTKQQDYMSYDYDDQDYEEPYSSDSDEDLYYEQDRAFQPNLPIVDNIPVNNVNFNNYGDDMTIQPVIEPARVRHRTTKSCPTCGEIVSRDTNFCPTCGTKLFVADNIELTPPILNNNSEENIEVSQQLLTPSNLQPQPQPQSEEEVEEEKVDYDDEVLLAQENANFNLDDGDDMSRVQTAPGRKVLVRDRRDEEDYYQPQTSKRSSKKLNEAASSYQEFSQSPYTRRAKKRKRSAGRKVLSVMLLVAAVGGALYFLLGLRKLPPGELPPMVPPDVKTALDNHIPAVNNNNNNLINQPADIPIAEPTTGLAVAENILPNFVPDREPKTGIITGNSVNFRADHTTSSASLGKLKANTRVEILDTFNVTSGKTAGIWYNINTNGKEGWVYGQYLRPVGSGLPSGYSNALLKTFGGNRSEILESLGAPRRSTTSSAEWSGLTATFKGDDITSIKLTNSSRELQNGLKTGMSQTALQQVMGYPSSTKGRTLSYNEGGKTGLSVQLDNKNIVNAITVNEIQ